MPLYSRFIYPQVTVGQSYTRPTAPSTFIKFGYSTPAWNPYSSVELERTEFWEDTAGTLSLSDVSMEIWGTTIPPEPVIPVI